MTKAPTLPRIIVDTREQEPFELKGFEVIRKGLKTGDYSLEGLEDYVAVERKSKADAYGCVGAGRDRFERCLDRLSRLERACVVIEASLAEFASPPKHTRIDAAQAVGSYVSWSCRYRIPVFFAGPKPHAERVMLRFLAAYVKHVYSGRAGASPASSVSS